MIKEAKSSYIEKLFLMDGNENVRFVIPDFQREYAWTKIQCDDLITDILDNSPGYFIGSVIRVQGGNEFETFIIDGQQRLTTISLLLLAVYNTISKTDEDLLTEDQAEEKINLKKMLVWKKDRGKAKLKLQAQGNNDNDYQYTLQESRIFRTGVTIRIPPNYGNRRISHNSRFFEAYLQELIKAGEINIWELLDKIKALKVIDIEVEDLNSAYSLFEAMNNRGLPLTAVDLIKHSFLGRKGDSQKWIQLISCLGEDYTNQDQFFRNNYNAFSEEYGGENEHATKSNLIRLYESGISHVGIEDFTDTILNRADLYSEMIGESQNGDAEMLKLFKRYREAGATSAFMLLLWLRVKQREYNITDQEMCELLSEILKFFVRRNLTNTPGTGRIPGILKDIIHDISALEDKSYVAVKDVVLPALKKVAASDTRLEEALKGDIYLSNSRMTKYVLSMLAREYGVNNPSKESEIKDFYAVQKNGKPEWSIEHVLPEGNNIPECWKEMLMLNADPDENARTIWTDWVHKLGNLTLTGYNSDMGNNSFLAKKGEKGLSRALKLNDYFFEKDTWTKIEMKERTDALAADIMTQLKLE